MSLRSPRSTSQRGFLPLCNRQTTPPEAEIPLTTIGTTAGKTNEATFHTVDMGSRSEKAAVTAVAGRRRLARELDRASTAGLDEFSVTFMGRIYRKIIGYSVVTRYLVSVLPIALLLAVPIAVLPLTGGNNKDRIKVGNKTVQNANDTSTLFVGPSLFGLFLWIETSWLSLWVGKIAAHLLPEVFMFFCGVVSSGTRKYATVLRALSIPLSLFFWALMSWIAFKAILRDTEFPDIDWVVVAQRILLSLFISSAVLLGEKAIVQLISISYHQRSFDNRIKASKREIYLLGLLYDASRTLFPMYCDEFAEDDYLIADSIETMMKRSKGGYAIKPVKLIGEVGRMGDKITSVFGNIASEITGKNVFNPTSAHSIVVEALERKRSSEALARRIWMSFVVEGNDTLSAEDIAEVLGVQHREEADECFSAIDADGNGNITLDEMITKVSEIGKERKALEHSMKDIGQALSVFDQTLLAVVFVLVVIIFLAVFHSSLIGTLTTAGTTLLSLSFVFATTCQEFLGSCIFLFVKHPYDVGDRVDIAGSEKEQLVVEKISLLFTVFTRIDKMQVVQIPNITLNNLWIENVTRSKAMKELLQVNVSFDTSFEDVELLKLEMEEFVRKPENSRDFQSDVSIGVGGVGDCDKLTLNVVIKHKSNWHNDAVRASRRSKFICALATAIKKIPIAGAGAGCDPLGGPNNPSYNVAVNDEFASAARKKAEQAKKAARLANKSASEGDEEKAAAEEQAAIQLNTRGPVDSGNGLHPQLSQHGRRKAGKALPPGATGAVLSGMASFSNTPGVQVTRASSSTRGASFDVEFQADTSDPHQAVSSQMYAGAEYAASHQQQGGHTTYSTHPQYGNVYTGAPNISSSHANLADVEVARARSASVNRPQVKQANPSATSGGSAVFSAGRSGDGGARGMRGAAAEMQY